MWVNTKRKLTTAMFVVACLLLTQIEPAAFAQGQNPGQNAPQTPAAEAPAPPPPAAPAKKKKSKFKALLFTAALVGGAAAIYLLKNKKKTEPTVTFGGPTVGNPQ